MTNTNQTDETGSRAAGWKCIVLPGELLVPCPGVTLLSGDATAEDLTQRADVKVDGDLNESTLTLTFDSGRQKVFRLIGTLRELRVLARNDDRDACRAFGERLNEIGGFALMVAVCSWLDYIDGTARMFVERIAWNGVGKWQS